MASPGCYNTPPPVRSPSTSATPTAWPHTVDSRACPMIHYLQRQSLAQGQVFSPHFSPSAQVCSEAESDPQLILFLSHIWLPGCIIHSLTQPTAVEPGTGLSIGIQG